MYLLPAVRDVEPRESSTLLGWHLSWCHSKRVAIEFVRQIQCACRHNEVDVREAGDRHVDECWVVSGNQYRIRAVSTTCKELKFSTMVAVASGWYNERTRANWRRRGLQRRARPPVEMEAVEPHHCGDTGSKYFSYLHKKTSLVKAVADSTGVVD